MVTVTNYNKRQSDEGREFFALTIQGGVEVVQSQNGNLYMTARKTSIPSTFDEQGCQLLIGKEIPGSIKKVECEPYEYENKNTGEVITLTHTYEYEEERKPKVVQDPQPEYVPYDGNTKISYEGIENPPTAAQKQYMEMQE